MCFIIIELKAAAGFLLMHYSQQNKRKNLANQ